MWRTVAHNADMNSKQRQRRLDQTRLTFANNVRTLRMRKQWTQAELADQLGISRATMNRIEVALFQPRFAEACLIADLLGVSISAMRSDLEQSDE